MAVNLISVGAIFGAPHYHEASTHCSAAAVQNTYVKEQCAKVADLLAARGTSLLDLGMAASIGSRAGWSAERVAQQRNERDALQQIVMQAASQSAAEQWSCAGARRGNAWVRRVVQRGEVAAGRELLEQSGASVEDLAAQHREYLESLSRRISAE